MLGLAEDGFNIVLNGSSDRAACESVAKEAEKLGAETLVIMGDVGKPEDCKRIADEAIRKFGAVDALLNNAALRPNKPFLEMSEDEWRRVILCRPRRCGVACARLPARHGAEGLGPDRQLHRHECHPWPCRPRAGVGRQARRVGADQGAGHGVRAKSITVNAISPGPIAPDSEEKNASAQARAQTVARVPLGRMGKPVEVAAAARLLVSEAGGYINGQMIQVNGGGAT